MSTVLRDASPDVFAVLATARESPGKPPHRRDQEDWEEALSWLRAALGETTFARLWAEGRAWPMEQAVAEEAREASALRDP
jgi:hypothetical protein